jgi:hypothetical protein
MTATVDQTVELHPVEVDLLCEYAEADPPFPLAIPAIGTTEAERRLMFRAAREQLAARGLAGRRGPVGPAAAFVRMLRAATGAVDLVLSSDEGDVGAVALIGELRAVLAIQSSDDPADIVRLAETSADNAIAVLVSLVPPVDAASMPPFTLPLAPVRKAFDWLMRPEPTGDRRASLCDNDIDDLLLACGLDARAADRLTASLRSVVGNGQAGVTRRSGTGGRWQRFGEDVRWVDTVRGRFRLAQDGTWVSVNPFSRNDVRSALRELGARTRT